MQIIPLKENNYFVDKTRAFIPLTAEMTEPGLKIAVQPFLVITATDYILLDVGTGYEMDGKPLIIQLLAQNGIRAEQITLIFLSHFHKDHIDGLGQMSEGSFKLNFPKAKVYGQAREYAYALQQSHSYSYNFEKLRALEYLPNMVWMQEDQGLFCPEIRYEVVGGHSPYLQVCWITTTDGVVFFGSDDLPQASYWQQTIAYKNDYDGKKARALRTQWKQQAQAEHWKILLYHDMDKTMIEANR